MAVQKYENCPQVHENYQIVINRKYVRLVLKTWS